MLKQCKKASLGIAKATGLFGLAAASQRRSSRLLVIGYHGVSLKDEHLWWPALYLSPEKFRSRIEAIRRYSCPVLGLQEALDLLYSGRLPERAVVLTFDDGTVDFRAVVWPILQEYGYPATLYLTTYWITVARPVVPVIWSYLLWKKLGAVYPALPFLGNGLPLDLRTNGDMSKVLAKMTSRADSLQLEGPEADAITQQLAATLGVDYDQICKERILHLLQPDEIRELAKSGLSVQLHSHRHFSPDREDEFKQNLNQNREYIRDLLGSLPEHFCYPSGRYKPEYLQWLRDLGIRSATTCDPALASRNTDPLLIPRLVDGSALSDIEFESWLVGVGDLLPQRARNTH